MEKRPSRKVPGRSKGTSGPTPRVTRSGSSGRFVSAAPVRTKAGSKRLEATLRDLGADPKVVEAARRD
jgi:hypothetical protein